MFRTISRILSELRALAGIGKRVEPPAYPPAAKPTPVVEPVMSAPFAEHDNSELDHLRALLAERARDKELAKAWTAPAVDDGRVVNVKGGRC